MVTDPDDRAREEGTAALGGGLVGYLVSFGLLDWAGAPMATWGVWLAILGGVGSCVVGLMVTVSW